MSFIERRYEGLRAECGVAQTPSEKTTFRLALQNYGFLVSNNTRLDLATFADRIEAYSDNPISAECARIVRLAA